MGREIRRNYLATPDLIQDGAQLAAVPVQKDDWIGLQRLLIDLRQVANDTRGTITKQTYRTAVEPDKRVQISTANGIQIYDASNNLIAQFSGDGITITGSALVSANLTGAFKTASSPAARVENDSVQGIRIYNSSNVLVGQFDLSGTITASATNFGRLTTNIAVTVPGPGTSTLHFTDGQLTSVT